MSRSVNDMNVRGGRREVKVQPDPQPQKTDEELRNEFNVRVLKKDPFDATMDCMIIRSSEFCELTNQLFSPFYADYEGSTYETLQGNNIPMVCLFFNHRDYPDDADVACTKDGEESNVRNSLLRQTRLRDRRMVEGDRYSLTQQGKDGIGNFIYRKWQTTSPWFTDKKTGRDRIDWRRVCSEVADPNANYFNMPNGRPIGTQYTKVSYLDPALIVAEIYGTEDDNGSPVEYGVRIVNSLPMVGNVYNVNRSSNDWLLCIERAHNMDIKKYAQMYNMPLQNGLNIHRSNPQ